MYITIAIILLLVAVGFKLISVAFFGGGKLMDVIGNRKAEKDLRNAESGMQQNMNKFNKELNYYNKVNEEIQKEALAKSLKEKEKEDKRIKEVKETLSNILEYLRAKYPAADEELFVQYASKFFEKDVDTLKELEKKMEQSHIKNY